MKILVYDTGHVDLEAPIHMTDRQREEFIEFFKKFFQNDVEVTNIEEVPDSSDSKSRPI